MARRQAVIQIDLESGSARAEAERLEQTLNEMGDRARFAGQGFDDLEQDAAESLRDTRTSAARAAASTNQLASSTRSMGAASSTANQLVFETTAQIQDLQAAGIRGATNALPMMSEQFLRLRNQAGGTRAMLRTLLSTFTSPTGILALGTLGLQALPSIIDFFQGIGEGAENAEDRIESLQDAASDLLSFSDEIAGFEVGSLEEAQRVRDTLQSRVETTEQEVDRLERARQIVLGYHDTSVSISRIQERLNRDIEGQADILTEVAGINLDQVDNANQLFEELKEITSERSSQLETWRQAEERAEKMVQNRRTVRDIEEVLEQTSADRASSEQDTADAMERQAQALNALRGPGPFETARNRQFVGRFLQQQRRGPLRSQIQRGIQPRPNMMSNQLMAGAMTGEMPTAMREQSAMEQMMKMVQEAEGSMQRFSQIAERNVDEGVNEPLVRGIQLASQLGTTMVQAAQQGSAEWNQVLGSILTTVGTAVAQANPVIGASIAGSGQLIGSFQHGGEVRTPLQIVGETGPELAALPQGTQVHSTTDTQEIIQGAVTQSQQGRELSRAVSRLQNEVSRLREDVQTQTDTVRAQTETQTSALQDGMQMDPYDVTEKLGRIEQEKNEFQAT